METNNTKNTAALIHLSTFSQWFIPFGNYIFPILIWSSTKDKSEYIDTQGKRAINFQLSLFLYSMILAVIAIPTLLFTVFRNVTLRTMAEDGDWFEHVSIANLTGMAAVALVAVGFFVLLKVAEFFLTIYASVQSSNGQDFKYPLTISFIK